MNAMNTTSPVADVLIVGMGPVGTALGNLLARQGLVVTLIDKAPDIHQAPRAIALDNEALRILQQCGLAEGEFDTVAIPEVRMFSPLWGGFGRARTAGALDGHPRLVTFFQPQLEQVLRRRLAEYPQVRLLTCMELLSLAEQDDGVRAEVRDAQGRVQALRARYVVGADGANSLVRRTLGLDFAGHTYAEDWLVVDTLNAPRPIDGIEFLCDPRRPTPRMVAPGGRQRWEFKLQPGETREDMERPDTVRRLLRPWFGPVEPRLERVAVYRFHARVAERFQRGRVFLAGDAAHITPPFIGQGLVAGLRDASNLAWKLAWVCRGLASPALLQSYTPERQPHVRSMIRLARWMGWLVMPRHRPAAWLIHGGMRLLQTVPRLRRLFERLEIKPRYAFGEGCRVPGGQRRGPLMRGGQWPQTWVRSADGRRTVLSDVALGDGLALVGAGVDPTLGLEDALRRRWLAAGGTFLCIEPRGTAVRRRVCATWEDLTGTLVPDALPPGWVAVLRPDRAVLHDGPASEVGRLVQEALACLSAGTAAAVPSFTPRMSPQGGV